MIDTLDPEKGPATKNCEDHHYDQTAYALRSRPWIKEEEYDDGAEDPILWTPPYAQAS
jgi:hypothetical protein